MKCRVVFCIMWPKDTTSRKEPNMENSPATPNPAPKTSSGLAIAGLVLGIIAAVTSFLPIINNFSAIIAFIGAILAVIALIGALRGKHTAKSLSIAGVVLCVVSFAIVLITQSMYSAALDSAVDKLKSGSSSVSATSGDSASTSDASSTSPSNASTTPSDSSSSEPAIEVDYSSMAIGQTVTLENGLSITVNSIDRSTTKYDGTPLVKASITYANNGSSSVSFNIFDWKCVDANGVETSFYYNMGDDQLDSGKLTAGGNVTGNVYFEGNPVKIVYYSNVFQSESSIAWVVS